MRKKETPPFQSVKEYAAESGQTYATVNLAISRGLFDQQVIKLGTRSIVVRGWPKEDAVRLFDIKEAAQYVRVESSALRERIFSGQLAATKKSGVWLIRHSDLISFLRHLPKKKRAA